MATAAKVDALYMVETPEGVDFQFRLAGPGRRGAAFFLDWVIKLSTFFLAFIALTFLAILPESFSNAATGFALLLFFLLNWLYSVLFEWLMRGQTPGKRAMNLRVVRSNGTPIDFLTAAGRGLLLGADALPGTFLAGVLSMLNTRKMQRTGDLVFDTIVIHEMREGVALTLRAMAPVEPIQKADCTGRFHVPERTLALIESLFDSKRYITGNRREELARILAQPIAQRLGFQLPAESGNYYVDPYNQEYFGDYSLFLRRVMETFGSRTPPAGAAGQSGNYGPQAYGTHGYGTQGYGTQGYGTQAYGTHGYGTHGYGTAGHGALNNNPSYDGPTGYGVPPTGAAPTSYPPAQPAYGQTTGAPVDQFFRQPQTGPGYSPLPTPPQPLPENAQQRQRSPLPPPVSGSVPLSQPPAAQSPTAQTPAAQTPAAQTPAAQSPTAQSPVTQPPVVQQPRPTTSHESRPPDGIPVAKPLSDEELKSLESKNARSDSTGGDDQGTSKQQPENDHEA